MKTTKRHGFYAIFDTASIILSFLLTRHLFYDSSVDETLAMDALLWFFIMSYFFLFMFYFPAKHLYNRTILEELWVVLTCNILMQVIFVCVIFVWQRELVNMLPDNVCGIFFVLNTLIMLAQRVVLKKVIRVFHAYSPFGKQVLVCVNEESNMDTIREMISNTMDISKILGVAYIEHGDISDGIVLGSLRYSSLMHELAETEAHDIVEYLQRNVVDEVFLDLPHHGHHFVAEFVRILENMGIHVHVTFNTYGIENNAQRLADFAPYGVITYGPRMFTYMEKIVKILMDLLGGLVGALLTCLISVVLVPIIRLDSPGPAFFQQTRIGKNGRRFQIYKFRSMYVDAEERMAELMSRNEMKDDFMFKMKDDPRITKVGRFIRKTSLDEFPQFFNVLLGDMSLVGTRPPTEKEFMHYEPRHKGRLSMKPGITGLWQISGRNDITDFDEVVKLDLQYIDNWSLRGDIKILLETVKVVFTGKGAS